MSNVDFIKLAAPFQDDELEWRPQNIRRDGTAASALVYVTARAIMERLDSVVKPENWQDSYEIVGGNVKCKLSIRINDEWISKEDAADMTDIEAIKGGFSGALKRAAVKWGIGRYLYNADDAWFPCESEEVNGKMKWKAWKKGKDAPRLTIDGKPVNAVKVESEPEPVRNDPPAKPKGTVMDIPKSSAFPFPRDPMPPTDLGAAFVAARRALVDKNSDYADVVAPDKAKALAIRFDEALGTKAKERHEFNAYYFGTESTTEFTRADVGAVYEWLNSGVNTAKLEFEAWREQYAFETLGAAS